MRLNELIARLEAIRIATLDLPVVLWDLDTGWYFEFKSEHMEMQRMADGSERLSIGPNSYGDERVEGPAHRPIG